MPVSGDGTDRNGIINGSLPTFGSVLWESKDSQGQKRVFHGSVDGGYVIPNVKTHKGLALLHARCISEPFLFTTPQR